MKYSRLLIREINSSGGAGLSRGVLLFKVARLLSSCGETMEESLKDKELTGGVSSSISARLLLLIGSPGRGEMPILSRFLAKFFGRITGVRSSVLSMLDDR